MKVSELIEELQKHDPDMVVTIRRVKSGNRYVDDFINISKDEVTVIEAQALKCPVAKHTTYDASIHAKVDTKVLSLDGKSITRPY